MLHDGWLKTGDVGNMNAKGYVTITDRKKDMILVSGFNVYPNEIESVVAMHPGRARMRRGGRARRQDGRGGEGGDREEGSEPDQGIRDRALQGAADRLQDSEYVEFRDTLPKTPIGKILRRELREPQKA